MTDGVEPARTEQIEDLLVLNRISETLNRAVDVRGALQSALSQLVDLIGMKTGWIFIKDPHNQNRWAGRGYSLMAVHNLPAAMQLENPEAWDGGCDCQGLCNKGELHAAYNEVRCSRLRSVHGDTAGLAVHASTPLRSGDRVLGILNVAAPNWLEFDARALALLTNVGSQMGVALERARLYDLLHEQRLHEQSALLDLSNQLLSRRDLDELINYLVEEARRLLEVDACALLLPSHDGKRLCFRADSGWRTRPSAEERCLPADERSGPGRVMQTQRPLNIEDLQQNSDAAPWMSDWLYQEDFQGHTLVPLIVEGRSIGVIGVNSRQPRKLDEDELRFLHLLANQAALAIETARLHEDDMKLHRMQEELAISQQIQLSMLPQSAPQIEGWQFAAKYRAARQVGGDFYDFFVMPGDTHATGIVIADVADKGVPAALFMALSRTLIRTVALSGRSPANALQRVNELLQKDSQSDVFLTAFYAILHEQTGELHFTNAGHNPPLWYRAAAREFVPLNLRGLILGVLPDVPLREEMIWIEPGDVLIFYTDGVTEAQSLAGEEFGIARLLSAVEPHISGSAGGMMQAVVDAINEFTIDTPLFDDFTLILVKRETSSDNSHAPI